MTESFETSQPVTLSDVTEPVRSSNDFYLSEGYSDPVGLLHASVGAVSKPYEGFKRVSAFNAKTNTYTDHTVRHQPKHAHTVGGKGLTGYTRPTFQHTHGMSSINNVVMSHGCSASCSFCKESLMARGFSQANIKEETGVVTVRHPDGDIENIPSRTKVKFYDVQNEVVVYGAISIPIVNGFPIAKDSIKKLRDRTLTRFIAD